MKKTTCCSTQTSPSESLEQSFETLPMTEITVDAPWIVDKIETPVGKVPIISTSRSYTDTVGTIKARLGMNRDNYKVNPGLYAVGAPNDQSPVLVTANYKLTFDSLRYELTGQNLWILVLDTKGINVWCAAGKGTFGTEELIHRIHRTRIKKVIAYKTIILPQLSAPGVAAHVVTKRTGVKVRYGPVYARDLPQFFKNDCHATAEMRKVHFSLKERLTVIPVEVNHVLKVLPIIFALLFVFNIISPGTINLFAVLMQTVYNFIPYALAIGLGTIGIAVLLPYIPLRSFAAKGLVLGLIWSAYTVSFQQTFRFPESTLISVANILILTTIISFFSLNFTGSTTFTSVSGVQKETVASIPWMIIAAVLGIGLAITYKIMLFAG